VVQTRFATSALMLLRTHLGESPKPLVEDAKKALSSPLPPAALEASRVTFLGLGWTVGLAHEGALKLCEAAQMWTEAYSAMEVRHGPISVLDRTAVAWSFGKPPEGLEEDIAATGATFVTSDLDPLADLIRAQRVAVAIAESRGLDPDHPRSLTRSVILARS